MANTENTKTTDKVRVNFLVDPELYEATFNGDRWDQRMTNSEYMEFLLKERAEAVGLHESL